MTPAINTAAAPVYSKENPRPRTEKNAKFANDGSLKSVDKLLHKLAFKSFARVSAFGLGMTLDDVLQEMRVHYLRAKDTWSADRGVLFSTYMTTVCRRNFNESIRKSEVERRNLGMINFTDMQARDLDGEDMDILEFIDASDAPTMSVTHLYGGNLIEGSFQVDAEAGMGQDPAEIYERKKNLKEDHFKAMVKARSLTENAKSIIADLVLAARARLDDNARLPKLSTLFADKNFSPAEIRRIRKEIATSYGVKV